MGFWTEARRRPMLVPSERATVTNIASSAALGNQGVFMLGSTSTSAAIECSIAEPVAGVRVDIICRTASTSFFHVDAPSSDVTFDGSNDRMTFGTDDAVQLIGYTSSRYHILNLRTVTTMAFSTST